ncbi:NAD(P)H-binding protein [Secundilactobacillus silagei]|uniref:NAD(P)-binding domain-containing protein n=1 Tax=Secundilactobacillus silagei JCM 19001 TaxID=1302250 RepID=A0A1Z5IIF5_9LACO|nr:NAD(P)H-binding protein [Secundilactobacillus silagei]TDG73062.1 hypothetical protein C5L25_000703 [Secundilactobacillus silagei JCM 19001]GAX01533.1 hypothetical protein IWT126_01574 [Secundilactobacillus silagei JCM 19001]
MTTYALTGATGHFGQIAIKVLAQLVPANQIVALARNTEKAKAIVPEGVQVRPGDYGDTDQLKQSLAGVDRLLLISSQPGGAITRLQQHKNVVDAAKAAGVDYIAYTSFPHADQATTPLAADHQATEDFIKATGINYSFLRNNWYLENEGATLKGAAEGKPFVYSAAGGKAGWALESEYAEAAADILAAKETKPVYEFAGQPRTYSDLAAATPGKFKVVSIDDDAYTKGLKDAGLDDATADLVTMFQTLIRDNQLAEKTTDLPEVLGRELTPLGEAIKKVIEA